MRKPPDVLARRLAEEGRSRLDRFAAPSRGRRFGDADLLSATGAGSVDELWERLLARPYAADTSRREHARMLALDPFLDAVLARADRARRREVDVLGTGPTALGAPARWNVDFKTGLSWPMTYARAIDYVNLDRPSDVKVPWEISRLQWLLPLGQAFLLSGDDSDADLAGRIVAEWIASNPYAVGVNWAVTMEVALRVISLTWLFNVFGRSEAWRDGPFRSAYLRNLYLHGEWTHRYVERSDVNGNHYAADAAGLVFAGLFFGEGNAPRRWADEGWRMLSTEIDRQVYSDGVDFEGSIAYHRLVAELFLLPALYRLKLDLDVPPAYADRLAAMAQFSAAATRVDGTTPLVGDHDDARVLPLGGQPLGDHRYLAGLVAATWQGSGLCTRFSGPRSEVAWLLGDDAASRLPDRPAVEDSSQAYTASGFYFLRGSSSNVFVDCGPVGLAGRGGHSHNDCLSLEAQIDGVTLVTDSGCYVYTASPEWRNRLRATAAHNTPVVDGAEQNRVDPRSLWTLQPDAVPTVREWTSTASRDRLVASHSGFQRLSPPITPVRTVVLDKERNILVVSDRFEGLGVHEIRIPFHLAPGVRAEELAPGRWSLHSDAKTFSLVFCRHDEWSARLRDSWFAPSYGVLLERPCLELHRHGEPAELVVAIAPGGFDGDLLLEARRLLDDPA